MTKNLVAVLFVLGISMSSYSESQNSDDYSYIGEYCTPAKFLQLPCLQSFCADIDKEMHIWANQNGSFESKLTEL